MLRIHYLQQWFGLSDPAMEEQLHDVPLYREFAKLDGIAARLPDETTILRFRHLLERHNLAVDMLRVVNDILQAKGMLMRGAGRGRRAAASRRAFTELFSRCMRDQLARLSLQFTLCRWYGRLPPNHRCPQRADPPMTASTCQSGDALNH